MQSWSTRVTGAPPLERVRPRPSHPPTGVVSAIVVNIHDVSAGVAIAVEAGRRRAQCGDATNDLWDVVDDWRALEVLGDDAVMEPPTSRAHVERAGEGQDGQVEEERVRPQDFVEAHQGIVVQRVFLTPGVGDARKVGDLGGGVAPV
ncbi:hypothetical protein Trco_001107 [Trichoderma cornu-damae]|uniref:Uncharacterized protein n=1 Tax=Trichoderma cornu-damae TaxID=654480 RepID=A0A9P8QYB2_9HYPO|nr:hypothetical protein Trco_001107 [Trichoderma cornu-damae]